ncbi:ATP-binding protein [Streptomyces sp. NPDC055051]
MSEVGAARPEAVALTGASMSASLECDGASVARARQLAAAFLVTARSVEGMPVAPAAVELVQLVLSELVTNALKYAPGPIVMELCIVGEQVEIVVWDSEPALPAVRAADAGRVGGHGLEIVVKVAASFDVRREAVGKRITVRLPLTGIE